MSSAVQLISLFKDLPTELKEIIYEYDPNRRVILNQVCNEFRLQFPLWVRKLGNIFARLFLDIDSRRYILTKHNAMFELRVSSECDNCYCNKSPKMILLYTKPGRYLEDYGGLFCNDCLELQNRNKIHF